MPILGKNKDLVNPSTRLMSGIHRFPFQEFKQTVHVGEPWRLQNEGLTGSRVSQKKLLRMQGVA